MKKVYSYQQKIFNLIGGVFLMIGVVSCATSQSPTSSGETDGVYYSPSKDGAVNQNNENEEVATNDYDIKVGNPYFDAAGNGAEEFYYDEQDASSQDINIYTGSNPIYVSSGASTDWGRYDGVDVTVNNWGWNNPWFGWGGYYSFGWGFSYGWGWPNSYWGYPRWNPWYNPYWGYNGGYYGYNPYWNYYSPYWGGGYGGYYGSYYPNYYYRGTPVRGGVRPGSNLAYQGLSNVRRPYVDNVRGNRPVRSNETPVRTQNVRNDQPVRNVRENDVRNDNTRDQNVRPVRTETPRPVRSEMPTNVRENQSNVRDSRPVRGTAPTGVRPNTPIRTQQPMRTQQQPVRTQQQPVRSQPRQSTVTPQRSSSSGNSGVRSSSSSSPSRGSSGVRTGRR